MLRHEIRFPRYDEDIKTKKRTLFHWLTDNIRVGDTLYLITDPRFPRANFAKITKVTKVQLCDLNPEDLVMLNVEDAATYLARWDAVHPDNLSSSNPTVYRIEFEYGRPQDGDDPPEWSLAG